MTEARRALDGVELAIRRVSDRLKVRVPWDMAVTEALDELASEIATISAGIPASVGSTLNPVDK